MSTSRFSKFSTGRSVRLQPLVDMDKVRLKQTKESTRIQELSNVHEHLVTLTMYKVVRQNWHQERVLDKCRSYRRKETDTNQLNVA